MFNFFEWITQNENLTFNNMIIDLRQSICQSIYNLWDLSDRVRIVPEDELVGVTDLCHNLVYNNQQQEDWNQNYISQKCNWT